MGSLGAKPGKGGTSLKQLLLVSSLWHPRFSPFPNTSTLLAGELKCKGITEEEDGSSDQDESSAAGEGLGNSKPQPHGLEARLSQKATAVKPQILNPSQVCSWKSPSGNFLFIEMRAS